MYPYGLFMLMYGRNQHTIVKQIILQLKINNFLKKMMGRLPRKIITDRNVGWYPPLTPTIPNF